MQRGDWFSHSFKCGICSLHTVKWLQGLVCTTWDCARNGSWPLQWFHLTFFFSLCATYGCFYLQFSSKQNMQSHQNKEAILRTTEVTVNLREGGGNIAVSLRPDLVVIYYRVTFLCRERLIGCIGMGRRDCSSMWGQLISEVRRHSHLLICTSAICSPDCLHVTPSLL